MVKPNYDALPLQPSAKPSIRKFVILLIFKFSALSLMLVVVNSCLCANLGEEKFYHFLINYLMFTYYSKMSTHI